MLCCRFHPVNTNLYVVASANGSIAVQNCSTGMTVASVETQHATGHSERPVAMATTPSMLCVGMFCFASRPTHRVYLKEHVLQIVLVLCVCV